MDCEKNENVVEQASCGCGCECSAPVQEAEREVAKSERPLPRRAYVPAVDLIEGENEVSLVVDVPGVPEDGVDLTIEKNILTLAAVPADGVIAGKKLAYSEYGVGEYRRSFALSEDIDREGISASLKNGVLRIKLPKRAPTTKKIAISGN